MLDQERIPIGKLKQAYGLNMQDVDSLLSALSPDGVFPYVLWQKAYSAFWRSSASEISRLYKVENPPFPDAGTLPDRYFPHDTYATWIVEFFVKLAAMVHVGELEKGLDYVIEATYDGDAFAFKQPKENLFYILYLSEKNIANIARTNGVRDNRSALPVYYEFIAKFFPDTVVVDKTAAIQHLSSCHYPLRREVQGITHSLVDSVTNSPVSEAPPTPETIASPTESAAEDQPLDQKPIFRVPASFWEWKSDAAVRDAMKGEYPLAVIAFVLVNWCGVTKAQTSHKTPQGRKTHVGRLLAEKEYKDEKSYRNFIDPLLEEAASYTIIKA